MLVCSSIIGCKFHFPSVPRFLSLRYCFNPALTREKKIADPLNNQSELCKCVIAFSDCLVILNGRTLLWDSNRSISSLSVPNYRKKTHKHTIIDSHMTKLLVVRTRTQLARKTNLLKSDTWWKYDSNVHRVAVELEYANNGEKTTLNERLKKNNGHQKKQKE